MTCGCTRLLDNAASVSTVLCVKTEGPHRVCKGGPNCPSDFQQCDGASSGGCEDKKSSRRCIRKRNKGKCFQKQRSMWKKCRYTCNLCSHSTLSTLTRG